MRAILLATVACLVGASACRSAGGVPDPAPSPATTPATVPLDQKVPAQAGGFRIVERQTLAGDGGLLIRFRDTSAVLMTLFLYAPEAAAATRYPEPAALLRYEADKFAEVMAIQTQRGLYSSWRMLASGPDTIRTPQGPVPGHMVATSVVRGGQTMTEQQHLYLIGTTFVKVRTTLPATVGSRADLPRVIAEIVTPLKR